MRTLLGTVLLLVSGCTFLDSGPSADDAAQDVAAALSAENLTEATFTGVPDAQQWWDDATEGLGDVSPEVTVAEVIEDGEDAASARLDYRWSIDGVVWSYSATARLAKVDNAWTVAAEPSLIAPDLRDEETLATRRVWAPRADILGADGDPIVKDRPVVRIGLDKTKVAGAAAQKASARAIAALVEVDAAALVGAGRGDGRQGVRRGDRAAG